MPPYPEFKNLKGIHVFGHRSSIVLLNVKGHSLTVRESFKPGCIDGGVVDKYIWSIILLDESVSLLFTEPFYRAFRQSTDLLSKFFYYNPKGYRRYSAKATILQNNPAREYKQINCKREYKPLLTKGQVKRDHFRQTLETFLSPGKHLLHHYRKGLGS